MKEGTHRLIAAAECQEALDAAGHGDIVTVAQTAAGLRFLDAQGRLLGTLTARHELMRRLLDGQRVLNAVAWTVRHKEEQPPHGMINVRVATGDEGEVYVPWTGPERSGPRTYPVGIVGEASYQGAIHACRQGEVAKLFREVGNPHDERAVVVKSSAGATIGYIPRNSWLQGVIHDDDCGVTATIKAMHPGPPTAVVLDVVVSSEPLSEATYMKPAAPSSRGWLGRLFKGA